MLNKLRDEIHQNAVEHGWWDEERSFGDIIDQVVELLVRKHKVKRKEEERVEIEIREASA